jgi:hypothetical protein
MSEAEELLAFQLKAVGIPHEREVAFAKPRRWRADFVVPDEELDCPYCHEYNAARPPLLIEIDGGAFAGGRHTSGAGFRNDLEKLNAATLAGYRVLRFLPEQVESGVALQTIEKALAS